MLCIYIGASYYCIYRAKGRSIYDGSSFCIFYGFIGTFASGHGLSCLYPVTIGLGFINYQNGMETGTYNIFRCVVVLLIMLVITAVMLLLAQDRSKTQKIKGKGDIQ